MITLDYPKDSEDRYLFFMGLALGPFDAKSIYSGQKISFNSQLGAISGTKGLHGENNVEHDKIIGTFEYHPILGGALPAPTFNHPRLMKLPIWYGANNEKRVATAEFGLAISGGSTYGRLGSTAALNQALQYTYTRGTNYLWRVVEIQQAPNDPYSVNAATVYKIKSVAHYSGDYWLVYFDRETYAPGPGCVNTGINWRTWQDSATIENQLRKFVYQWTTYNSSSYGSVYRARPNAILSPSSVKGQIDMLVGTLFPDSFPIQGKHYGELAMEASERTIANQVNMIAFLKDLRHPTEMIPKLKNLSKLKGLADNFLTVKYGILPTISDIQDIMASFKKMKPYFDKKGFKTYTAGYRESKKIGPMTYNLEQHIKLAIGVEDSGFDELLTRLESFGFLPTFENLWDMVPYSFVIDWLVDVGGFLERIDTRLRLARLNIQYVTMSRKTERIGRITESDGKPFVGAVNWVQYHRWVSDQCPVPPLSLQENPKDFNHWLESGALLVQRAK